MAPDESLERSLTLHSSWRGIAVGYVGPVVLLALTMLAVRRGGIGPVTVVIGAIGLGLLLVLLFDYPVATRFDAQGVLRRMPLRRHRIGWERISQLTRTRARRLVRPASSGGAGVHINRGGLVAVVGRRRYLLVDQAEALDEFDLLSGLLGEVAPELVDHDLAPPEGTNPTFLYRRSRARPPNGGSG